MEITTESLKARAYAIVEEVRQIPGRGLSRYSTARNRSGAGMNDTHRTSVSAPDMESNPRNASMEPQTPARSDPRFDITVTSYRKRKHDPDGVSIKAVLDGIIRAGILSDDSSEIIRQVTFRSEISETERTVIEIDSVTI